MNFFDQKCNKCCILSQNVNIMSVLRKIRTNVVFKKKRRFRFSFFQQIVNKAAIRKELNESRGYCYDTATCQTLVTVSGRGQVMLNITLTLTLILTRTYTRSPMFDRLQRRNNNHSVKRKAVSTGISRGVSRDQNLGYRTIVEHNERLLDYIGGSS